MKIDRKTNNITVTAGDDNYIQYHTSDFRDISEYEFWFTVKPFNSTTTDDSDAVFQSTPDDIVFLNYTDPTTLIEYPNSIAVIPVSLHTDRIDPNVYKYDLQEKNGSNIKTRLKSTFTIEFDVTKAE